MMRTPKLKDAVEHPTEKLLGQIERIRNDEAIIFYITDEKIKINLSKLIWTGQHWRIND
jgi:hypothetical protein